MVNVVGWVREFLRINWQSLPPKVQYFLVMVAAACAPILWEAFDVLMGTGKWDGHGLWKACVKAVFLAHIAHRIPKPSAAATTKLAEEAHVAR